MPPRKPAEVQVPGEVPQTDETVTEAVQPEGEQAQAAAPEATANGDTVTVDKAQFEAMLAQMRQLSAEVAAIKAKPVSRVVDPQAALPESDDIDLRTMKNPVLTKQGWLVPESYGANPNAPKAF